MRELNTLDAEHNGRNFLMGVVCGAAVGAAVGLLLAPKAGAELRHQIAETTNRLRHKAAEGYEAAAETVSHVVDDVVARGKHAAQRGQETYDTVRKSAADVTHAAVKAANDRT